MSSRFSVKSPCSFPVLHNVHLLVSAEAAALSFAVLRKTNLHTGTTSVLNDWMTACLSFSLQSQWAEGNLQASYLGLTVSRQLHLCRQRTVSLLFSFLPPQSDSVLLFSPAECCWCEKEHVVCLYLFAAIFNCCLLATCCTPGLTVCLTMKKKKKRKSFASCSVNLPGSHWLTPGLFFRCHKWRRERTLPARPWKHLRSSSTSNSEQVIWSNLS